MTGRRLTTVAQHADGRLRLSDLRHLIARADEPTSLPSGKRVPPIREDAVVDVVTAFRRHNTITLIEEEGA